MRYELADCGWAAIQPFLPNKPPGMLRVNDRRVLNGIFEFCARARHGATCRTTLARTLPATISSFAGDGRASGAG